MKMSDIVNTFKATGIFPFNVKAVCPEKYGPSTLHSTTTLSKAQNDKNLLTAIACITSVCT